VLEERRCPRRDNSLFEPDQVGGRSIHARVSADRCFASDRRTHGGSALQRVRLMAVSARSTTKYVAYRPESLKNLESKEDDGEQDDQQ
jgi:hypothetical protein